MPVAVITGTATSRRRRRRWKLGAFDFIEAADPATREHHRERAGGQRRTSVEPLGESPRCGPPRDDRQGGAPAFMHISGEPAPARAGRPTDPHHQRRRPRAGQPRRDSGRAARSEFFGHRKGVSPGPSTTRRAAAVRRRRHAVPRRNRGSAVSAMQVKLLRVIQEEGTSVGVSGRNGRGEPGPPRLNLGDGERRQFHEDLYYASSSSRRRYGARRRRILGDHILARLDASAIRRDAERTVDSTSSRQRARVENMLERGTLAPHHSADLHMRSAGWMARRRRVSPPRRQVEDIQRQAIVEALEKTRYNKTQAAKLWPAVPPASLPDQETGHRVTIFVTFDTSWASPGLSPADEMAQRLPRTAQF